MCSRTTRRQFLVQTGAMAAGAGMVLRSRTTLGAPASAPAPSRSRVIIARDDKLVRSRPDEHQDLLNKMLAASMQRLTGTAEAATAWRRFFSPTSRIGIKVNTLGLTTRPAVVTAIVAGLREAGVPAENIVIWDRFDVELARAGYKLNKSNGGVQCRGTDSEHYGSGYQAEVQTSGRIGSCYSRILAEQVDGLISVPVLKDHNLAGVSLGMKNFFGAIHNPNKYHGNCCDPYVTDVIAHPFIRPRWKLTVCDGILAQYHGGPTRKDEYAWHFGGLIISNDVVAADAVAADLLEQKRREAGMKSLVEENRDCKHILTAATRGFGIADLARIDRVEV